MTDTERVEALRGEITRLAELFSGFPVEQLVAGMSDTRTHDLVDMMCSNRKKASAIFREVADEFEQSGKVLDMMRIQIRKLESLSNNLKMIKELTDTLERLAALEKSGFVARIKPLLQ